MNKFVCILVSLALAAPLISQSQRISADQCGDGCKQACSLADSTCITIPNILNCEEELTACNGKCDEFCQCESTCKADCDEKAEDCDAQASNVAAGAICMANKLACEGKCPITCTIPIAEENVEASVQQAAEAVSGVSKIIESQLKGAP